MRHSEAGHDIDIDPFAGRTFGDDSPRRPANDAKVADARPYGECRCQ